MNIRSKIFLLLELQLSLSAVLTESVGFWLISTGSHLATVKRKPICGEAGIEELGDLSSCI